MSDLPPPPAPPGAGPPQPTRTTDPWRKYLVLGLVGGVLVLVVIRAIAGLVEGSESSDADTSAACSTVDMEPLTEWGDPITVVQLDTTDSQGRLLYAWGSTMLFGWRQGTTRTVQPSSSL